MKKRLFVLEIKKNLKALPVFFAAMMLMGLVIFLLVFAGSRMLYNNESPLAATIAVVSYEEDSSYINRLASYLGELSSASKGLSFKIMDEEKARSSLEKGKVFAIMLIPDGMMEGILWGSNIPATVILPDDPDLSSMIFAELTRAGADMLSAAQAGTYTASYLFSEANEGSRLGNAYDQIDLINFGYVLEREELFKKAVILPGSDEIADRAGNDEPVLVYYVCSGILLFAFFSTVAFSAALKREDPGFYGAFESRGGNIPFCILIKYLAHFAVLTAVLTLVYLAMFAVQAVIGRDIMPFSGAFFAYIILLGALLSAFDLFWHMLAQKSPGAVLLQLIFSLFMLFAGGAILPKAFLPDGLTAVGELLPASGLHHGLLNILNGAAPGGLPVLCIHTLIFLLLAIAAAFLRKRGDKL